VNRGSFRQMKVGRAHTDKTAPLFVPLLFWITGVFGILMGLWRLTTVAALLLRGLIGSGEVLGAVHSFTLAGFTMLMMGALYQLGPVLLNVAPVPTNRVFMQWSVYTLGLVGFLLGLLTGKSSLLEIGGVGVVLGILLFIGNVGERLWRRTTFNVTAWFFTSALAYLLLTVVMGGLLVIRYTTGHPSFPHEVPVHMTIALGGWFGLLVCGTSYRLWQMFGLKHQEPRYWLTTWGSINGAIILWIVGLISGAELVRWVGWLLQMVGFFTYLSAIVRAGMGDRRTMRDPALRTLVLSLASLGVFEVLGSWALVGHVERLWIGAWIAYGLGWIGLSFLGFAQKIVPFMIWLHRYAHVHGQGKMPRLEDIWRPKLAYPPMGAVGLGMAMLLLSIGDASPRLFRFGAYLIGLGWLFFLGAGIRSIMGPHRRPE
jgi:hypothetical protein